MKNSNEAKSNGYQRTIEEGLIALRQHHMSVSADEREDSIPWLKAAIKDADAVVIGAGAGLSTAAGFVYTGERFERYFGDFAAKYHFTDMYAGGFYPYRTLEEQWAFWSRYIYINRYTKPPKPVYENLLKLVKDKDCFVLTTNVDHCFQRAGFDKSRLFYTQGDYGLWQCSVPCHHATYDNEQTVRQMVLAQGYTIADDGTLTLPEGVTPKRHIPTHLIPLCPVCGKPMSMNLRADHTFVEDDGWYKASAAYADFLDRHKHDRVVYLEIGVGANTPVIIKYPFWKMTIDNDQAYYACLNFSEAYCPKMIEDRSVCITGDAGEIIKALL